MRDQVTERTGFLFEGTWEDVDPETARITTFEEARQVNKLIMIASESIAPPAVRRALGSVFTDLYAEGYPALHTTREPEALIEDIPYQVAYHERYSDRRYYKGTEFADLVEALAQNRIRHLFAPNRYPQNPVQIGPEQIQANVQPWSGANANSAVYIALLQPGDTIMGLNLSHGGHLSHGSPVNLSGKFFKVVPYSVNPETGRIDYDELERLAREHNPRLIVSGASAYPWDIDFGRLRQICDSLPRRAYLLADISHPAGLVVAGLFSNPVGIADVTTFTTHKTLIGPRAAIILTTNESLSRRIDRAVFPGLQGGPHVNTIAALAVAFKIAQQPEFDELQRTIVANAQALADTLAHRGLTIAYGGTTTHLLLVDLRTIEKPNGLPLNGDVAARILDLCGIVCNKNTIAGDVSANYPSGIRLGTPWLTQRGLTPDDMRTLGGIIADVLYGIETYPHLDRNELATRGKIPPALLKRAQSAVADLIKRRAVGPPEPAGWPVDYCPPPVDVSGKQLLAVYGRRARAFLSEVMAGPIWPLEAGRAVNTTLYDAAGQSMGDAAVLRLPADQYGMDHFVCAVDPARYVDVQFWLESLSTGLVLIDPADVASKIDGPVAVASFVGQLDPDQLAALQQAIASAPVAPLLSKPYFIGQQALVDRGKSAMSRPRCKLSDDIAHPVSPLASPPAGAVGSAPVGWTMPLSYGNALAELQALQNTAALIDESALGILELSGPDAGRFLDLVTTNDVAFLARGAAQYTFVLDPNGEVLADALLYRTDASRYLLTTAPSESIRVKQWLEEVRAGGCAIDFEVPSRALPGNFTIVDLRNAPGDAAQVVLGLAGPNAPAVLRALGDTAEERRKLGRIRRFTHGFARLAGIPVMVSRTSHTGVPQGYEIFVASEHAQPLWEAVLKRGAALDVRPAGWQAFRAAGITAGLPWIKHELNGKWHVSPVQAGYSGLVRDHKPFFIGRRPFLARPYPPADEIARFRINGLVNGLPGNGDPVLDSSGVCVGRVTSRVFYAEEPVGLAEVRIERAVVGTSLSVLVGAADAETIRLGESAANEAGRWPSVAIAIVTRFPK
ncbi:MAG TPA: serine hydroxymethyltransferase [Chloroflexota bacterium]|nr:serine hydroxymethyltransferase [Chloroflexota bacterium]